MDFLCHRKAAVKVYTIMDPKLNHAVLDESKANDLECHSAEN